MAPALKENRGSRYLSGNPQTRLLTSAVQLHILKANASRRSVAQGLCKSLKTPPLPIHHPTTPPPSSTHPNPPPPHPPLSLGGTQLCPRTHRGGGEQQPTPNTDQGQNTFLTAQQSKSLADAVNTQKGRGKKITQPPCKHKHQRI